MSERECVRDRVRDSERVSLSAARPNDLQYNTHYFPLVPSTVEPSEVNVLKVIVTQYTLDIVAQH